MSDTKVLGRARPNDPTTSWSAASEQTAASQGKVAAALRVLLASYGPLTDEESWAEWEWLRAHDADGYPQITPQRLRTVRAELVRAGEVVDTGARGTSLTGRPAVLWAVKEE